MDDKKSMNLKSTEQGIESNERNNIVNTIPHQQSTDGIKEAKASTSSNAMVCSDTLMPTINKVTDNNMHSSSRPSEIESLAAMQLAAGFLQIFEPPLVKVRGQLKELICKQNKIYIDLSAEKFKLDNTEITHVQEMMNDIKIYRGKLLKIKKQMQQIYQRTKLLKKRANNIEAFKQKELQRKLQKQQQEESLIGNK